MLVETGKKIFYLSPDTGKESGNISTPDDGQADERMSQQKFRKPQTAIKR